MRRDDLQLLQWTDEVEQANSYIGNGHNLLQQLAQRAGVPWHENLAKFAMELALAYNAGYVTWTDRSAQFVGRSGPTNDPQHVVADHRRHQAHTGRTRQGPWSRGRSPRTQRQARLQVELPDANEDDGRMITGLTLEEIVRSIGDTYTAAQLPRYLR